MSLLSNRTALPSDKRNKKEEEKKSKKIEKLIYTIYQHILHG